MQKGNVEYRFSQKDAFVGTKGANALCLARVTRRVTFTLLVGERRFAPDSCGLSYLTVGIRLYFTD